MSCYSQNYLPLAKIHYCFLPKFNFYYNGFKLLFSNFIISSIFTSWHSSVRKHFSYLTVYPSFLYSSSFPLLPYDIYLFICCRHFESDISIIYTAIFCTPIISLIMCYSKLNRECSIIVIITVTTTTKSYSQTTLGLNTVSTTLSHMNLGR